jgi:hypothetical protein
MFKLTLRQSSSVMLCWHLLWATRLGGGGQGVVKVTAQNSLPLTSSTRSVRTMLSRLDTTRLSDTRSGMPANKLAKSHGLARRLVHWLRFGVWHARVDSAEDTGYGMPIRTLAKIRGLAYRLGHSWRSPLSNDVNCSGQGERNTKLHAAWHTGWAAQLFPRSYEKLNFYEQLVDFFNVSVTRKLSHILPIVLTKYFLFSFRK